MRYKDFNLDKLIENLEGTCQTIDYVLGLLYENMEESDLTEEEIETLESNIFLCDCCGWWFEVGCLGFEYCNECED